MKGPVRILIVDDHALVRSGLRTLLGKQPDLEVVGEAAHASEALEQVARIRPDIALVDLSLPDMQGEDAIPALLRLAPETQVVVLTMHDADSYLRAALRAGARGYVVKSAADEELVAAIRVVARGQVYIDPAVAHAALPGAVESRQASSARACPQALTPRELEVLRLYAAGHTSKQAAERLGISVKTVETHKSRGLEKLGLRGRAALVRHAMQEGWLQDRPPGARHRKKKDGP